MQYLQFGELPPCCDVYALIAIFGAIGAGGRDGGGAGRKAARRIFPIIRSG